MNDIRLAIVGYGGMGSNHGGYLWKEPVKGARLAAVCDIRPERLEAAKKAFGNAMHLPAWLGKSVDFPVDEDLYWKMLQEKIAASTTAKKAIGADRAMDFTGTF